jgi:dTDP-4-amino-4,6-dideoxygalactose transaminase
MSSATGALEIALQVAGVQPGDEVITTPLSWVATANVILRAGAKPVFVDVDAITRNIDLDRIEAAITPRTRALLPVDMAGLPVDRDRLYELAWRRNLRVIEDAAQSMGASWNGQRIGSCGDLVALSFHANKNITSGEGGCLVLTDPAETDLCTRLRLQGVVRLPDGNQEVEVAGGKHNLTDISARIGLGQMKHLEAYTARRRSLARRYFEHFDRESGCELPLEDYTNCNWHMFQILLPLACMRIDRGGFIQAMHRRGIGVGVHYPAMHLFKLYRNLGYNPGDFPQAERIGGATVTLPLFPGMADADIDRVCAAVAEVMQDNSQ